MLGKFELVKRLKSFMWGLWTVYVLEKTYMVNRRRLTVPTYLLDATILHPSSLEPLQR